MRELVMRVELCVVNSAPTDPEVIQSQATHNEAGGFVCICYICEQVPVILMI